MIRTQLEGIGALKNHKSLNERPTGQRREFRSRSTDGETNDKIQNRQCGSNAVDADRNPGICAGGYPGTGRLRILPSQRRRSGTQPAVAGRIDGATAAVPLGDSGPYAYMDASPSGSSSCAQRYRSYDPESGTYLGYDRNRHPCQ